MNDSLDLYNALKQMKVGNRLRLDAKTQTIFAYHMKKSMCMRNMRISS